MVQGGAGTPDLNPLQRRQIQPRKAEEDGSRGKEEAKKRGNVDSQDLGRSWGKSAKDLGPGDRLR